MKEKQKENEKMKEETKIIKKSLTVEEEQQVRERKLQIRLAKARALKFEHEEKEASPPKEDKKDQEVKMTKSSTNEMKANFNDVLELDEDEEIRVTREKFHSHKLNASQQINEENVWESPEQKLQTKKQIEEEEDSLDAFMSHIESNNNIIEILIN